jgi:PPM family protein phosphatase
MIAFQPPNPSPPSPDETGPGHPGNLPGGQNLEVGLATDPGRKRGGEPNQDAILFIPAENGRPPLFIVADGMGGHAGGAEASRLVINAVASHYCHAEKFKDLPALLQECLQKAFNALVTHATSHPELAAMGSTAVLAAYQDDQVVVCNVGDSRAYQIRYVRPPARPDPRRFFLFRWFRRHKHVPNPEPTVEILQLSYDHSVVADQVRAGQLTPLQALRSSKRNRLTQSITPRRKEIKPFTSQFTFEKDDTLLLCTDGLWGVVPEATLAAVALELPLQEAADKLVQQAVSYGGPDNVSVIIACQAGAQKMDTSDETNPDL